MAQVTLNAVRDADVISLNPDNNQGQEGLIHFGHNPSAQSHHRVFIGFDVSSIPTNAVITSAVLRVWCFGGNNHGVGGKTRRVERAASSWTELGVTWNNQPGVVGNASDVFYDPGGAANTWLEWQVSSQVQEWINGQPNNGFRIIHTVENGGFVQCCSRDNGTFPNLIPQLVVTYFLPPTQPGVFTSPTAEQVVSPSVQATWGASTDPDGDLTAYELQRTINGGTSWEVVNNNIASGTTSVSVNTSGWPNTVTARLRVRARDAQGLTSAWRESPTFTVQHNQAPTTPTLLDPHNGSAFDATQTKGFGWQHNDPNGDPQDAWAFRRKLHNDETYQYWRTSDNTWQSSIVWNAGSSGSYTFPADSWVNNNTYNWSVATRDPGGLTGPFANDRTVITGTSPSVTVTKPDAVVVDTVRPLIEWSFTSPSGAVQSRFHVKVFTLAVVQGGGFDPDTSESVWDSGEFISAHARSWNHESIDLDDGEDYRAYVRARDSNELWSNWSFKEFIISLEVPQSPTVETEARGASNPSVLVTVYAQHDEQAFPDAMATVQRKIDDGDWAYVRNAVRVPYVDGTVVIVDYEAPFNVPVHYRAWTEVDY